MPTNAQVSNLPNLDDALPDESGDRERRRIVLNGDVAVLVHVIRAGRVIDPQIQSAVRGVEAKRAEVLQV